MSYHNHNYGRKTTAAHLGEAVSGVGKVVGQGLNNGCHNIIIAIATVLSLPNHAIYYNGKKWNSWCSDRAGVDGVSA